MILHVSQVSRVYVVSRKSIESKNSIIKINICPKWRQTIFVSICVNSWLKTLHVSRVSRGFWAHAESAEFAEAHIASLVLAMRDRVSRKSIESIK